MAKVSNPYVLIPIFLNVILLMGLPFFGGIEEVARLIPLLVLAFAFPWILAWVIGKIVHRAMTDYPDCCGRGTPRHGDAPDNSDFV